MKKKSIKIVFLLSGIFFLAFFLRVYKLQSLFAFGHEQDLQAWIIKDILIDKHLRLIGQETSIHGVFIGPLYYYMLIPFYAIFKLNPLSGYIPITLISLITLLSVYFVTNNLYNKKTALIASLIYAVSPTIVFLDRWLVPTQTTLLWTIWFYFVLVKSSRGNLKPLPILIILIGLIWHIHVAFIPLLILVPIAFYLSKNNFKKEIEKVNKKYLKISVVAFLLLLSPFVAFEMRHNFQQTKAIFNINKVASTEGVELREGVFKVEVIAEYMNRVIWQTLFPNVNPKYPMIWKIPATYFIFLLLIIVIYKKKLISKNELIIFLLWLLDVFAGQYFSKHLISDYYFNNLIILALIIFSLFASYLSSIKFLRFFIFVGLIIFALYNIKNVVTKPNLVGEFIDKSAVTESIGLDVKKHNYLCVGINYIGDIPVRYGYRFLIWKNDVNEIMPGNDVPVYSIVQPFSISAKEISYTSGNIGVILPKNTKNPDKNTCEQIDRQLLPLNGFVN